jgi:hypothetical protein
MKCIKCPQETDAEWKTLCRSCYKNRSTEEIREQRQNKLNRKVARLQSKAQRLEGVAEQKQAEFNSYRGDVAFMTQPASKSSAFGKKRDKIFGRYEDGIKLQIEAKELKDKANYLQKRGAVVKGDAERKRQVKREEQDKIIAVGSKVYDILYGKNAEVIKVNKKTYRVRLLDKSKWEHNVDKTHIEISK